MENIYTGRQIALFTDVHGMYEPLESIMDDIKRRGITEIYSLGDSIIDGPSPVEVLKLMQENNVSQVLGNSECYVMLGTKPFNYISESRNELIYWTLSKISDYLDYLNNSKASIDLDIGEKKVALCHFINDVRWDYSLRSTWTYQRNYGFGKGAQQFLYTNSPEYQNDLDYYLQHAGILEGKGCKASYDEPLFHGKRVTEYDDVFQGHVHFEMEDELENTKIHTIRAAGMGWQESDKDLAGYIILKEKIKGGFDTEKVYVPFDKEKLMSTIYYSDMPEKSRTLRFLR